MDTTSLPNELDRYSLVFVCKLIVLFEMSRKLALTIFHESNSNAYINFINAVKGTEIAGSFFMRLTSAIASVVTVFGTSVEISKGMERCLNV